MKMKHASIFALALALSPSAFARDAACSADIDGAQPYIIAVKASRTPTGLGGPDYPYRAAREGIPGECEVVFNIAPSGTPVGVYVASCSAPEFERKAMQMTRGMTFEPTSGVSVGERLTISWRMDPARCADDGARDLALADQIR